MQQWTLVKTCTLIAWIFTLIVAVACGIYLVFGVILGATCASIALPFAGAASGVVFLSVMPFIIIALTWMILAGFVYRRAHRMYRAATKQDIATLKGLNSIGWAVTALFCAGLPGLLLLVAHSPIEELASVVPLRRDPGTIACSSCGRKQIPSNAQFCPDCGNRVEVKKLGRFCSTCGAQMPERARFCAECGAKLAAPNESTT